MTVTANRVTAVNDAPVSSGGAYVLYWMIAARRTGWNHALEHAVARAIELDRPLVVLEPLRAGYPWASDRLHRFVIDGMADNARAFANAGVTYLPYVEPSPGDGKGLLAALAARAACVVTDEYPCFFLPRMVAAAGAALPVRLEQVDSNGLLPLREHGKAFATAAAFRRHWQKTIQPHLVTMPAVTPLRRLPRTLRDADLPAAVLRRWPRASDAVVGGDLRGVAIDHSNAPVDYRGGSGAADAVLEDFVDDRIDRYADERSNVDDDVASGLSPYLHFGHIAVHEVVSTLWDRAGWDPTQAPDHGNGRREGWWSVPPGPESFLDEIVTWRELGHGFCFHHPDDYDRYESLPEWARKSLDEHAGDPRPHVYSLDELAAAATHDPLWNAAQTQLVRDGRIHNYLRMLWGKKILEWSRSPRQALAALIELNNRYAVDGRDPNSYSGIFWTLGRFDRPWAPVRPIFGVIRYMSSENTARKMRVKDYVKRYS